MNSGNASYGFYFDLKKTGEFTALTAIPRLM
jgi:hypothetical protein